MPEGRVAASPEEAGRAFDALRKDKAVVKAQIHAGGRGKAGGVVAVASRGEAEQAARSMLGRALVTGQTGPQGRPVDKVLVEEAVALRGEYYAGVLVDRLRGRPLAVASSHGGVEIEELARREPQAILREAGNPFTGIEPFQARKLASGMGLPHDLLSPLSRILVALGRLLVEKDCSLVELNPLGLAKDGRLVAADVKMAFDDNAANRHPELAELRDPAQEDPREVEAKRHDLNYVGLGGSIGCMVNGAGLAMATMDLIRLCGGEPANFLDVGGAATSAKVAAAFRLICRDERVKAILVNIFGGIVRCDLIAEGVLEAAKQAELKIPLVVRLEGTEAEAGRRALAESPLEVIAADSLRDAAEKAVKAAGGQPAFIADAQNTGLGK